MVDACIVVCDGLKGLPESITTVWAQALVQACVLHLIRNTFRYASRRYWEQMAKDLRPVYTAATEQAAHARFDEFTGAAPVRQLESRSHVIVESPENG